MLASFGDWIRENHLEDSMWQFPQLTSQRLTQHFNQFLTQMTAMFNQLNTTELRLVCGILARKPGGVAFKACSERELTIVRKCNPIENVFERALLDKAHATPVEALYTREF